jgi:EAL domain-containing protein (putative c-di-GMP-specific phosphodiesterase class I)
LRDADTVMYRAKAQGKARHEVFDQNMHARVVALLRLENDLRRAVERDEFRLQYQPIVSLDTGRVSGFEALVRWQHPELGLIQPGDFIPVAEETGVIVELGQWVLEEACRRMRVWQLISPQHSRLKLSVNLSSRHFVQPDLYQRIVEVLAQTGLAPATLQLEITESILMENAHTIVPLLGRLRDLGVELAIDDFGTGYSSLSYLSRLKPIHTLKIDRSFISMGGDDHENAEIVRTIIMLARNMGKEVVAEGIETAEQLARLRTLNCAYGQGYLFSRPQDPFEIERRLRQGLHNVIANPLTNELSVA